MSPTPRKPKAEAETNDDDALYTPTGCKEAYEKLEVCVQEIDVIDMYALLAAHCEAGGNWRRGCHLHCTWLAECPPPTPHQICLAQSDRDWRKCQKGENKCAGLRRTGTARVFVLCGAYGVGASGPDATVHAA